MECQPIERLQGAWDRTADLIHDDPMRPVRYGRCLRYLHAVPRTSRVLEVGCGEGTGLAYLRHLGFRDITGCEISAERLRRAELHLKGAARLVQVGGDGPLPFAGNSFDVVISAAVIEHVLSPAHFVMELWRILRPGGTAVVSSDCWQWRVLQWLGAYRSVQPIDRAMFPTQLIELFRDAGFAVQHCEGFALPGQEWRFLRTIAMAICNSGPIARIKALLHSRFGGVVPALAGTAKTPGEGPDASALFRDAIGSPFCRADAVAYLRLIFSDENVFHLAKTGSHA